MLKNKKTGLRLRGTALVGCLFVGNQRASPFLNPTRPIRPGPNQGFALDLTNLLGSIESRGLRPLATPAGGLRPQTPLRPSVKFDYTFISAGSL